MNRDAEIRRDRPARPGEHDLPVESLADPIPESAVDVRVMRTPGLGDSTYLLAHAGVGVVVDPQRDIDRFLTAADDAGVRLRYVLETHVHNDYVSGGRELARQAAAELVLPAAAGVAFDHTPAFHLEELASDGLTIRPVHTPGHTPEHVSYLVLVNGQAVAIFTGGSLLVGSAGRPDLLGTERAYQLALAQFTSINRLASLPDELGLYPTHGAGSFCTASRAGESTSTIGAEKRTNPVLRHRSADAFARAQLDGLQPYPRYYAFMSSLNVLGPTPLPERAVPELRPAEVQALAGAAHVVDARPRAAFARGHVPGALGVELAEDFGTWVGWLVPFNAPIVLVLEADQDLHDAVVQLGRIGFDDVRGVLRDMDEWRMDGRDIATFRTVDVDTFADAIQTGVAQQVLDVRSPAEWAAGSAPRAIHRYVPDLVDSSPETLSPARPVWTMCASGFRASVAAGLLERLGFQPVVLSEGGVADIQRALARPRRPA